MIFNIPQSVEHLILEAEERLGTAEVLSRPGPSKFGWSKLKKFLQCKYLAFYPMDAPEEAVQANENQELGTVLHRMLEYYYLPESVCDPIIFLGALKEVGLADDLFTESKRIFSGYVKHYGNERGYLTPLGVEQELEDPSTGLTCKMDLLADFNGHHKYSDGIYIVDHKTRSRIDAQCLMEWFLDGQVLMNMHLCEVNGITVKGFIANIIGKQKTQRFERVLVPFVREQINAFRRDMEVWMEEYRRLEKKGPPYTRDYACTGRYGLCDLFEHCRNSW